MERPPHLMIQREQLRPAAIAFALLIELAAIILIATGLTVSNIRFFPHLVEIDFYKTERPEPKPVPLPQLKFVPPPIPVVPPPEIQIQIPKPPPRIRVAKARPHPVVVAVVQRAAPSAPPPVVPSKPRGVTAPVSIGASHTCTSRYPVLAVRLNQQGTTTVRFMVNTDGSVSDVRLARSSGHEMLDEAALGCASAWRYRPALDEGRPVTAPWTANIQWKLRDGLPA